MIRIGICSVLTIALAAACGDDDRVVEDALVFDTSRLAAPGVVEIHYGRSTGDEFAEVEVAKRERGTLWLRVRIRKATQGPDNLIFECVRVTGDPEKWGARPHLVGWEGKPLFRESLEVVGPLDCHAPDEDR